MDRASFQTRISKEGQALTDARYFIKNRGNPNFRLTIPPGATLWSASINGTPAVPVSDGKASLVPLPQSGDPNGVLELDLKLASQSSDAENVTVSAPIANAPVMLAEWKIAPDPGRRLVYRNGSSLQPAGGTVDVSGFAQLARLFQGDQAGSALTLLFAVLGLVALALAVWRWMLRAGAWKYGPWHIGGLIVGLVAFVLVMASLARLAHLANDAQAHLPGDLRFLAPVQKSGSALHITVSNILDKASVAGELAWAWPALAALVLWLGGWMARAPLQKFAASIGGWTLLAWAALRTPNGAPAFFWILPAFLAWCVLIPALRQLSRLPRKPAAAPTEPTAPSGGAAPATLALLAVCIYGFGHGLALGAESPKSSAPAPAIPDSVTQTIRVEDKLALATAKIRWQALKGQSLPLLSGPAVLTHVVYPERSLKLAPGPAGSKYAQEVVAQENGVFDIEEQYEVRVSQDQAGGGFACCRRLMD